MGQLKLELDDLGFGPLPLSSGSEAERAADLLARADHVLIFMGSGLSQESGLSTFRAKDTGLYQRDMARLTHAQTFEEDAQQQLRWHARWLEAIEQATPNEGHHAMARIARMVDAARSPRLTLATQNVDLLLERALHEQGVQAVVHHVHGRLDRTRCHERRCDLSGYAQLDWRDGAPCPVCQGRLRPDVIWFGEALDHAQLEHLADAAAQATVCMLVGTSGLVYPAASLPQLAKRSGARLIEINPHESALSDLCDVIVRQRASQALVSIEQALKALTAS